MIGKIKTRIKLLINAGLANPSPPIGPILGQQGINIMKFCKEFNSKTERLEKGLPVSVVVTIYSDRSFTFIVKSSPVSVLLKKAAGVELGSNNPGKSIIGKVNSTQIKEIAINKIKDMNVFSLEAAIKSIKGTARSIGLELED